ncbi:MAG: hypothetical protein F6K32_22015 [Desertifilum sp. SIO1I2]|nr:hypothetical protein [Desertifilum sp. SIO1I2]
MLKVIIGIDEERHSRVLAEALEEAFCSRIALTASADPPIVQVLAEGFILPQEALFCPLTLKLPSGLDFPAKAVYQACQAVEDLRQVVQGWGYGVGEGRYWLPIVRTAKGSLYAEAIALTPEGTYVQPFDLVDGDRQPLYHLSHRLLEHLRAAAGVYLVQFDLTLQEIVFDRLLPFPDVPALASIGVQSPDLLVCHWSCLLGQPLHDLTIVPQLPETV